MKIDKYSAYKDSGVEWLGEIPEHWEVKKLSHCFSQIGSGTTPKTDNSEYYNNGEYYWLQTGDLNDNEIWETSKKITKKALKDYTVLKFYPLNSIVIAMYGATIGKTGILKVEMTTNQACCVISRPKDFNCKFVFYCINAAKQYIISMSYGGGQPNINKEQIKNLKIQYPPLTKQTAIANFLDTKTAKIDQAISQKQKLIELLKERKQIIIQNAVTKGLDPNVKMKDSGVDIGKIPFHWEVKKLKYVVKINKNTLNEKTAKDFEFDYIDISSVSENGLFLKPERMQFKDSPSRARRIVKSGDTIISTVRTYLKAIAYFNHVKNNTVASTGFAVLSPSQTIYKVYLNYLIRNENFLNRITANSVGIAYPAISTNVMGDFHLPIPPYAEQQSIVSHIETQSAKIDKAIDLQQKQIEKLKEYKIILINSAVTGKIKVS